MFPALSPCLDTFRLSSCYSHLTSPPAASPRLVPHIVSPRHLALVASPRLGPPPPQLLTLIALPRLVSLLASPPAASLRSATLAQIARAKEVKSHFLQKTAHEEHDARKAAEKAATGVIVSLGLVKEDEGK